MKEKTSDGQIIIVLTEHPVLGILLIPYIAERLSDNTLQLVEQAFHASAEAMNRMSEAERQAIDIASHYTEKYLMGVYSREKTVSRFLHKLSEDPERIKNNVRPFIEKKLQEMLALCMCLTPSDFGRSCEDADCLFPAAEVLFRMRQAHAL